MNDVLQDIFTHNRVRAGDGTILPLQSAISLEQGRFLQQLISELQPMTTLEVGLAFGVSALFICESLSALESKDQQARRHIVMDPSQHEPCWRGIGLLNLQRAGYEAMIEFHELPSQQALPQLEQRGVQVDFAFIDGWHTFDHALVDCFYVDKLLRPGGLLVLDDVEYPGLHKLCRFWATNRAYQVHRSLAPAKPFVPSWKRQIACRLAALSPRLCKPEWIQPSETLGIVPGSRCVAFKKIAADGRSWDDYKEF
jgi:predicted O-methyltransferase YrrM